MYFQKVLKGIAGLTREGANESFRLGILCNWWRRVGKISPQETVDKLTERNLDWHLNHYDDPDPLMKNAPFSQNTPFISVTSGVVERDAFWRRNIVFDPLITALRFATRDFTATGHIFYAYVFTLGRQSIGLRAFAEEVRELNIYKNFLPYHPGGGDYRKDRDRWHTNRKMGRIQRPCGSAGFASGKRAATSVHSTQSNLRSPGAVL